MTEFATPAGITIATFREYEPQAKQAHDTKCRVLLRMTSNAVATLAPPPDGSDAAYTEARGDCELTVAAYGLRANWGETSSYGAGDRSYSFEKDFDVMERVKLAMGGYYRDPSEISNVGYVSTFRR